MLYTSIYNANTACIYTDGDRYTITCHPHPSLKDICDEKKNYGRDLIPVIQKCSLDIINAKLKGDFTQEQKDFITTEIMSDAASIISLRRS